ncbi:hypothetical protein E2986_00944 [Frieseomelitta varia]|uniref:GSKIP domain-containing protein n=2 Tax=Frieseomelitta varia TaxID=561572 RepID=A0A833RWV2_9HYME|nr:hypothetical protein E2986_00944 [Frieseomelitta varia]
MKEEANNEEPNKEQWILEAQAIIDDVKQHVTDIKVSNKLRNSNQSFHLNLTTLEGSRFCIEVSTAGFTVVGNEHDDMTSKGENERFETPYSLLNFVSSQYKDSFGSSLVHRLEQLNDSSKFN